MAVAQAFEFLCLFSCCRQRNLCDDEDVCVWVYVCVSVCVFVMAWLVNTMSQHRHNGYWYIDISY